MVKDTTAVERVRRHSKKRRAMGWYEVRVWVPSKLEAICNFAVSQMHLLKIG